MPYAAVLLFLGIYATVVSGASKYFIGAQGLSCYEVCYANKMNCNPHIETNNSVAIFNKLGIQCQPDARDWWAEDQPGYVADPSDPNYKKCLGYTQVPDGVMCGASYTATQRLCYCDDPNDASAVGAFGTGLSNGILTATEQIVFNWIVPDTVTHGVMTHFWATCANGALEHSVVRYYIDGATTPQIAFVPPVACGSAIDQTTAPWGTNWFGKGAKDGSWFLNFRIPFQKTIRITVQSTDGASKGGFYIILRGAPSLPINIGGITLPTTANLLLQRVEKAVQPLDWVNVVDVPKGSGLFFMHTLYVQSTNLNCLEGCYHAYTPYNQGFPGTVVSTGTEDYFDSGWYFNAGEFRLPVSGMTHLIANSTQATVSAYRFHEMDPMQFSQGFKFVWRNGDIVDPAGRKCFMINGGSVVGSPGVTQVTSYGWVYVW